MRAQEVRQHQRKQPFAPFRMHLSDGSSHDIRHPELILVGQRELVVALDIGADEIPARFAYIDPVHVVKLENLPLSETH